LHDTNIYELQKSKNFQSLDNQGERKENSIHKNSLYGNLTKQFQLSAARESINNIGHQHQLTPYSYSPNNKLINRRSFNTSFLPNDQRVEKNSKQVLYNVLENSKGNKFKSFINSGPYFPHEDRNLGSRLPVLSSKLSQNTKITRLIKKNIVPIQKDSKRIHLNNISKCYEVTNKKTENNQDFDYDNISALNCSSAL